MMQFPRSIRHTVSLIGSSVVLAGFAFLSTHASADLNRDDPLPRSVDKPLENLPGVDTFYGSVEVEPGVRLRSMVTRPTGSDSKLHPILFTQAVSCGSLELSPDSTSALAVIAKESGMALVRVDRAGAGDSQGPACDELDYDTEVAHYIAAYEQILQDERIDSSRVYVYGSSLGSTTAPLVAISLQNSGYNIEGVVVQGGGAVTYLERMINFDRYYLERRPDQVARADIQQQMNDRIHFHVEYLVKGRHPDEIAKDSAAMQAVRNDTRGLNETNHYGRPFTWHQQAAKNNFLQAWETLNSTVLVIFNEYEQFETLHGHQLIVDEVNRKSPGSAKLIFQEGLGHSSWRYSSMEDAYNDIDGVRETHTTGKVIVDWLRDF